MVKIVSLLQRADSQAGIVILGGGSNSQCVSQEVKVGICLLLPAQLPENLDSTLGNLAVSLGKLPLAQVNLHIGKGLTRRNLETRGQDASSRARIVLGHVMVIRKRVSSVTTHKVPDGTQRVQSLLALLVEDLASEGVDVLDSVPRIGLRHNAIRLCNDRTCEQQELRMSSRIKGSERMTYLQSRGWQRRVGSVQANNDELQLLRVQLHHVSLQ